MFSRASVTITFLSSWSHCAIVSIPADYMSDLVLSEKSLCPIVPETLMWHLRNSVATMLTAANGEEEQTLSMIWPWWLFPLHKWLSKLQVICRTCRELRCVISGPGVNKPLLSVSAVRNATHPESKHSSVYWSCETALARLRCSYLPCCGVIITFNEKISQ